MTACDEMEGLRATGGAVVVVRQDETLAPDPDEWPEDLFQGAGELLFQEEDVVPSQVAEASPT